MVKKKEIKAGLETSVKSYQRGIDVEKQKMEGYSKKFGTSVEKYRGDIKAQIKKLGTSVEKYRKDIKDQIKENKEAVSHMADNVAFFLSEIEKKKKDFQSYAGAFWGRGTGQS